MLPTYRFRFHSFWRATLAAGGAGERPSGCDGDAFGATGATTAATKGAVDEQSRDVWKRR